MRFLAALLGAWILAAPAWAAYTPFPSASTPTHILSAATDNAQNIKASAGTVFSVVAVNTTETVLYLKFYDSGSVPNCGVTAVVLTLPVPASASGAVVIVPFPVGMSFLNGIGICLTRGGPDNDDTSAQPGVFITVLWN